MAVLLRRRSPVQKFQSVLEFRNLLCTSSSPFQQSLDLAEDLQRLKAVEREGGGSRAAARLRKTGRTPAILFSLPQNESRLISMDSKQVTSLVRVHGRKGLISRVLQLELETSDKSVQSFPVLPRLVHINSVTDEVENITLMHCPPDRMVTIAVPIKIVGEELSPGVKKGGHLNLVQRTVKCTGAASAIPESIEIDVSSLDFGQRIYPSGIEIPPGVSTVGLIAGQPLCKVAGRAARD